MDTVCHLMMLFIVLYLEAKLCWWLKVFEMIEWDIECVEICNCVHANNYYKNGKMEQNLDLHDYIYSDCHIYILPLIHKTDNSAIEGCDQKPLFESMRFEEKFCAKSCDGLV